MLQQILRWPWIMRWQWMMPCSIQKLACHCSLDQLGAAGMTQSCNLMISCIFNDAGVFKRLAHLAQGMVDRAEAVIGLQKQEQLAWDAPPQAADLASSRLSLSSQLLLFLF